MTTKVVRVTRAQERAARLIVERSTVTGRPVSPGVRKIAEASERRRAAWPEAGDRHGAASEGRAE